MRTRFAGRDATDERSPEDGASLRDPYERSDVGEQRPLADDIRRSDGAAVAVAAAGMPSSNVHGCTGLPALCGVRLAVPPSDLRLLTV